MNIRNFQLFGTAQTQKEVDTIINQMLSYYDDAANVIQNEINNLYINYLSNVDPDNYYSFALRTNRLESLLDLAQSQYNYYFNLIGRGIENSSRLSMSNTWYRQQYVLSYMSQDYSITLLDPIIIELSVIGTPEAWTNVTEQLLAKSMTMADYAPEYGSLSQLLLSQRTDDLARIQQTISSGLIQGLSNRNLGNNIQQIMNNFRYQAERIARTETARTMNLSHQVSSIEAQSKGLNIMRMWVSSKDNRVRATHAALDGKLAEPDKPFKNGVMRPGAWPNIKDNINERCTTIDVLVDENGEIDRPQFMRGRNPVSGRNEVYQWSSFNTWADKVGIKQNKYGEMFI